MENFDVFRLDGHTLRVFLTVCDTGSISKTADAFHLNQSTISHTIDKMRHAVGDPLFVKSGRGITPTEKSLSLIPQVQKILSGIEGLVIGQNYDPAHDTRPVKIGVPTPALMPAMKAVYLKIQELAPKATFEVARLAPSERLGEMLRLETIDFGISVNMPNCPAFLKKMTYGADRLVVYYDAASRDPIRTIEDYKNATHAVAGFGGSNKSIVEKALDRLNLRRQIGFVAPTASTLGEFLLGTKMIATMPLGLAGTTYSKLAFCEPPISLPGLNYDLVWHRRFEHSGRSAWIKKILLETSTASSVLVPTHGAVPERLSKIS